MVAVVLGTEDEVEARVKKITEQVKGKVSASVVLAEKPSRLICCGFHMYLTCHFHLSLPSFAPSCSCTLKLILYSVFPHISALKIVTVKRKYNNDMFLGIVKE